MYGYITWLVLWQQSLIIYHYYKDLCKYVHISLMSYAKEIGNLYLYSKKNFENIL